MAENKPLTYDDLFAKYPGEDAILFLDEARTANAPPEEAEYRLVRKAFRRRQGGKLGDADVEAALGKPFTDVAREYQNYTAKGYTKKGVDPSQAQQVDAPKFGVNEALTPRGATSELMDSAPAWSFLPQLRAAGSRISEASSQAVSKVGEAGGLIGEYLSLQNAKLQLQNGIDPRTNKPIDLSKLSEQEKGEIWNSISEQKDVSNRMGRIPSAMLPLIGPTPGEQFEQANPGREDAIVGPWGGVGLGAGTVGASLIDVGAILGIASKYGRALKGLESAEQGAKIVGGRALDTPPVSEFDAPFTPGEGFGPALPDIPPELGGPRTARGSISDPIGRQTPPTDKAINSKIQGDLFAPRREPVQPARKPLQRFTKAPEPIVPRGFGAMSLDPLDGPARIAEAPFLRPRQTPRPYFEQPPVPAAQIGPGSGPRVVGQEPFAPYDIPTKPGVQPRFDTPIGEALAREFAQRDNPGPYLPTEGGQVPRAPNGMSGYSPESWEAAGPQQFPPVQQGQVPFLAGNDLTPNGSQGPMGWFGTENPFESLPSERPPRGTDRQGRQLRQTRRANQSFDAASARYPNEAAPEFRAMQEDTRTQQMGRDLAPGEVPMPPRENIPTNQSLAPFDAGKAKHFENAKAAGRMSGLTPEQQSVAFSTQRGTKKPVAKPAGKNRVSRATSTEEAKLDDYIKKSGNFESLSGKDILDATVDSWKKANKAISDRLLGNTKLKSAVGLDDVSIKKSMAYSDFQGQRAIRDEEILGLAKARIKAGATKESLLGKGGFVETELRKSSNEMKATLVKSIQKIKPDATEREILSQVSNFEELMGWERSMHEIVNVIKEGKVLGSGGGGYLNNAVGDTIFEVLRGGGGFKHYKRAFGEVKAAVGGKGTSKDFRRAMKDGLFGSEAFAGDIKNAVKVAFNDLRPDKASNIASQAIRAAAKKGAQGRRFLSHVYDGTDKVAKFSAYLDEFEQRIAAGMSESQASREAVQAVYEFFPNYEKLHPALQKLRKNVVGALIVNPFVAFPSEAARIFKNAALKNPLNFMAAAIGTYGLYNYGVGSAHLSKLVEMGFEGRGDISQEEINDARKALPSYSKFFGKYNVPLPWRDSEGNVQFLDATYMIPLMDVLNGGQGWKKEDSTPENVAHIFSNAIGGTFMRGLLVAPNELGFENKAEMGPLEALRQTGYSAVADRDISGAATNFGEFLRADTKLGGVNVPGPGRILPGILQKAADIPKVGKYESGPRSVSTQGFNFMGLRTTSGGPEAEQRSMRSNAGKIRELQDKARAIMSPTNKQPEATKQRRIAEIREQVERLFAEDSNDRPQRTTQN